MAFSGKAWQYWAMEAHLEDSLTLCDNIPTPPIDTLPTDMVIVEVLSAAINPVDYKLPEAPIIGNLTLHRPATPGLDLCGRVVAKHPSNTDFSEGQLVFGGYLSSVTPRAGMGTLRSYAVLSSQWLAALPEGVEPAHAAAIGTAGTSAYQSLRPDGEDLKEGAKVLINGGSGGVGTWTVQLAKTMGAHVTTTCSTGNVDLCQQLGADEVVDYRKVDLVSYLEQKGPEFDLIIDNVANDDQLYNVSGQILKPGGTFVQVGVGAGLSIGGIASIAKRQLWPTFLGGGPRYIVIQMANTREYLEPVGTLMSQGKVKAVIDRTYEFDKVPDAFRYLREGHAKGKIIINVAQSS